jgi:hypothetical protein
VALLTAAPDYDVGVANRGPVCRWDIGKLICRWVGAAPRRLARMGTGLGASLAVSGPLLLRRDRGTSPERPAS